MPEFNQILINLIATIIFIPINALILWAVIKWLIKLTNKDFLTALKTAAAAAMVLFVVQQIIGTISEAVTTPTAGTGFILAIAILLLVATTATTITVNAYAVKRFYKEKTRNAFLVGTVWSIATWIIGFAIGAILIGIAAAIMLGSSSTSMVA